MHDALTQLKLLVRALRTDDATQWLTHDAGRGENTWTGVWKTAFQTGIEQAIAAHVQPVDRATATRLIRSGRLPSLRDITYLYGVVVDDPDTVLSAGIDQSGEPERPLGIPVFHHGVLEKAYVSEVQQAKHIVRYLDDFHEPTIQAIRRRLLRQLEQPDDEAERHAVGAQAIEIFLQQPVRWRDVVEATVLKRTVRAVETEVGERIRGPRRTSNELRDLIERGITTLYHLERNTSATQILRDLHTRQERLAASQWVLMYEEYAYPQLSGVLAGQSIRRHLPRGLHVIFSDQIYRSRSRIAGLWLDSSDDEHTAEPYYYAPRVPAAYASRQRPATFRLPNEDALWRYVEHDRS